jgi:hypothetical protein
MTLQQAVEVANRARTIQATMIGAIQRGSPDQLLDHAVHAYKAAIVLFDHATEVESALNDMMILLEQSRLMLQLIISDPDIGERAAAIITESTVETG